jgi:hypothetical protein
MCVFWVVVLWRDARIGCALGGREGIVYTVGDKRKFAAVGLGNAAGFGMTAVFGWRWDVLLGAVVPPGESGGGIRLVSMSGGLELSAAPNVAFVGVRAGFRSGKDGVGVLHIGSSPFPWSLPMMS